MPLIKGLRLTQIYIALKERQEYTILTRTTSWERVVATTDLEIQEEIKLLNEEGEEGWLIHDALYLPVSLKNCIQDVDALGIRIRHSMQFELYFVDSHGMTSQVQLAISALRLHSQCSLTYSRFLPPLGCRSLLPMIPCLTKATNWLIAQHWMSSSCRTYWIRRLHSMVTTTSMISGAISALVDTLLQLP